MFLKTSFKIYHLQGLIQDFSDEGTYPKDVDVNLLFWTIIYENEKKGLRLTPVMRSNPEFVNDSLKKRKHLFFFIVF